MDSSDISHRSRGVSLALATMLGPFGAHRFYNGKIATGLLMLCTFGGGGIWWLYDTILVASGVFRDDEGRRVVNWAEGTHPESREDVTTEHYQELLDEIYALRSETAELAERVDFMERLFAQTKHRAAIPPE